MESESLAVLELVKKARWICSPPSLQRQNHKFPQLSSYMDAGAQTQFIILAKRALHQRDHLLSSTLLFCYCLEPTHTGLPADWLSISFYSKQSQVTLQTFGLALRTQKPRMASFLGNIPVNPFPAPLFSCKLVSHCNVSLYLELV